MTQLIKETPAKSVEDFLNKLEIAITLSSVEINNLRESVEKYHSGRLGKSTPTKRDSFQIHDDVYKKAKLNIGGVIRMEDSEIRYIRLSDIGDKDDSNQSTPVAIDILDENKVVINQMKVYSGKKKPIRGTEYFIEIGEVFQGRTLNGWADIYVLKEKKVNKRKT